MSVSEEGPQRSWSVRSAAPFVSLLLVAPVAYHFGLTVAAGAVLGPALLLAAVIGAAVLCVPARASGTWSVILRGWLLLAVITWLYLVMREGAGGTKADAAAIFVPVSLLLIWAKKPSRKAAWAAADALAWSLVATSMAVLILEVAGVIPSWYEVLGDYFVGLIPFDRETHWLMVNSLLGLDGRSGGILRDPNAIGPVGALLAVYGFARPGLRRIVFVAGGVAIVVLSDSRATYGAIAFGLLALLLLPGWGVRLLTVTPAKAAAAGIGLLAAARLGYDFFTNPAGTVTLTGRTSMWPDFLSLWPESPVVGVGSAAIEAARKSGVLPVWSTHGHNQYIDTLVRYGVVGTVLVGSLIALGVVVSGIAARHGRGLSVALWVVLVVAMTSNLVLDWRYPSVALSWILVAMILAATTGHRPTPERSAQQPTRLTSADTTAPPRP